MTTLLEKVAKLLKIVSAMAPAASIDGSPTEEKLFELAVLVRILRTYRKNSVSGTVTHIPPVGKPISVIHVAGGPASRNRALYSHFQLAGTIDAEAWISVQALTLSWHMKGRPHPIPLSARHEIDVAIFQAGSTPYPTYDELILGASCKHVRKVQKVAIREVMGLRRETAYLDGPGGGSLAPWIIPDVPTLPSNPIFFFSSDRRCLKYQNPIDSHGVYVRHLTFPVV